MNNKIVIIENSETTFNKLKENLDQIGDVVVTFDEITDSLTTHCHYRNISDLVTVKMKEYGKEIAVFIIDLQLSGDNTYGGIQIIKDIRNVSVNQVNDEYWRSIVPIIVCTQYPNYESKTKEAGANCLIRKSDKLEVAQKAIDDKPSWKRQLNKFLTNDFLPVVKKYNDWYCETIKKIENTPMSIRTASIKFFKENNDPDIRHAFVMTSFAKEYEKAIEQALTEVQNKYFVNTYIANKAHGQTSDDLFDNIRGYMHCCDFGIGIYFCDPRTKTVNVNLSVEVGYMLGLGKRICYLKDVNLEQLNTDLIAKIYTEYKKTKNSKGKKAPTMENALIGWIEGAKGDLNIKSRE